MNNEIKAIDVIHRIIQYADVFHMADKSDLLSQYPMMIAPFEMFLLGRHLTDSFVTVPRELNAMLFYGVSLRVVE